MADDPIIEWHRSRGSEDARRVPVPRPVAELGITGLVESVPSYTRVADAPPPADVVLDAAHATGIGREWDEAIINRDDRVRIDDVAAYPWRAICALRIRSATGRQYVGTGWLAGPRTVMTAGHCVYLHEAGGWAQSITVIPAMAGASRPIGSFESRRFRTVDGWVQARAAGSDYGAILLDDPIGDELGWFGVGALDDPQLLRAWANIAGYPLDRDDARHQYFHARLLVQVNPSRLYYDIDTFGGQSGSPIWFTGTDGRRIAIGIHTTGGTRENAGTRITGDVLANLREWRRDDRSGAALKAAI
ncbi:MAG: trypsin-like peptidase domain-containing protein [Gemmatimonadaceae bacterium]|nr:trypsin-like peptidase domain-containing protein [Gemmatimonadaceae bacterium]